MERCSFRARNMQANVSFGFDRKVEPEPPRFEPVCDAGCPVLILGSRRSISKSSPQARVAGEGRNAVLRKGSVLLAVAAILSGWSGCTPRNQYAPPPPSA